MYGEEVRRKTMTDIFNSFTEYQKQTNLSVTELEEELVAYIDPEVFILNEDIGIYCILYNGSSFDNNLRSSKLSL